MHFSLFYIQKRKKDSNKRILYSTYFTINFLVVLLLKKGSFIIYSPLSFGRIEASSAICGEKIESLCASADDR